MTNYSYAQLEGIWINNGGSPGAAPMAAAIAMAESGGDPNAANNNTNGTTDRGLWQINSIWGALSTFDVNGNAKAAIQISNNGSSWSPWVTFTTGAYKAFLSSSTSPDTASTAAGASGGAAGSAATASTIATYKTSDCLVGIPNLNPIPSWVPIIGTSTGVCLFSKAEARGALGGILMFLGGGVAALGFVILAAGAFGRTGGLGKAADVAAVIPGGQPVAAGLAVANRRATRTGEQARARRAARAAQGQSDQGGTSQG